MAQVNSLKQIKHFKLHPELLPYIGFIYGDYVGERVLLIGECTDLTKVLDADKLADKVEFFKNWYEEPTPFEIEGLTGDEWGDLQRYYNIRRLVKQCSDGYTEQDFLHRRHELVAKN